MIGDHTHKLLSVLESLGHMLVTAQDIVMGVMGMNPAMEDSIAQVPMGSTCGAESWHSDEKNYPLFWLWEMMMDVSKETLLMPRESGLNHVEAEAWEGWEYASRLES